MPKSKEDLEIRKLKWEVWQHIITIAVIVVGGFWSVFTFVKVNQAKLTQIEVEKFKNDTIAKPSLEFSIDVQQTKKDYSNRKGVFIDFLVKNNSNRNIPLLMGRNTTAIYKPVPGDMSLFIFRYDFETDLMVFREADLEQQHYVEFAEIEVIPPNSSRHFHYYWNVRTPGVYVFGFKSLISDETDKQFILNQKYQQDFRIYLGNKHPDSLDIDFYKEDSIKGMDNSKTGIREQRYWIASKYFEVI